MTERSAPLIFEQLCRELAGAAPEDPIGATAVETTAEIARPVES